MPLDRDAPMAEYEALTAMLHRAYRAQVEMGLRPLAGRQSVDVTLRRCRAGETFVARSVNDGATEPDGSGAVSSPLGMILFEEQEEAAFPAWFLRPEVAHFSLLAVEPAMQGHGVGAALLRAVEARAAALGLRELALSMAEPDAPLLGYYRRRGFRFVQHWQWPYTNYRSAILSRAVGEAPKASPRP
ncbi:MAG: GNAT family N-acetyltransferase [Phycisphaerales bacterium]